MPNLIIEGYRLCSICGMPLFWYNPRSECMRHGFDKIDGVDLMINREEYGGDELYNYDYLAVTGVGSHYVYR